MQSIVVLALVLIVTAPLAGSGAMPPAHAVDGDCAGLNEILVPNCPDQALFGAAANDVNNPMSFDASMRDAEQRYGRDFPVWHSYHPAGADHLPMSPVGQTGAAEVAHAEAGGIPLVSWKPVEDWSTATGNDAGVNAMIQQAGRNVRAVAPHPVMLTIYHEPQDNVGGGTDCPIKPGNPAGNTPATYRAMWANVERQFAAVGATNVVWVMNYMSYDKWDCLLDELWPGDNLVDWVGFDAYQGRGSWDDTVGRYYRLLNDHARPGHDYAGKPYILMEFGSNNPDQPPSWTCQIYADAKAALDAGDYPNLRGYLIWDSHANGANNRTDQTADGTPDPDEQAAFNAFANDPLLEPRISDPSG